MSYTAGILTVGERWAPIEFTLRKNNIQKAVFICTPGSRPTIDSVLRHYPLQPSAYTVFEVQDTPEQIGALAEMTHEAYRWLHKKGLSNDEILVDPTAGRKWMSAGITVMAAYLGLNMGYVDVKTIDGKIDPETMRFTPLPNVYDHTGLLDAEKAIRFFNGHMYDAVEAALQKVKEGSPFLNNLFEGIRNIARGYKMWDLFGHIKNDPTVHLKHAAEGFRRVQNDRPSESLNILIVKIEDHVRLLKEVREQKPPHFLFILDLVENAKRRKADGRLDDATGRLYRALEALSQYFLVSFGITDTGNPQYKNMPPDVRKRLQDAWKGDLPSKISLETGWALLNYAGCPAAQTLMAMDKKTGEMKLKDDLKGLLGTRNNSILAHGFDPISEKTVDTFLSKIDAILHDALPSETDAYRARFEFPQLPEHLVYEKK